jgi:hypothetical protein
LSSTAAFRCRGSFRAHRHIERGRGGRPVCRRTRERAGDGSVTQAVDEDGIHLPHAAREDRVGDRAVVRVEDETLAHAIETANQWHGRIVVRQQRVDGLTIGPARAILDTQGVCDLGEYEVIERRPLRLLDAPARCSRVDTARLYAELRCHESRCCWLWIRNQETLEPRIAQHNFYHVALHAFAFHAGKPHCEDGTAAVREGSLSVSIVDSQ